MISKKAFWIFVFLLFLDLGFLFASSDKSGSFILGREQGNGFLYSPEQILEGPDGNIYVYDSSDAFIKVYSPQGKYLRRMGGKGQGPGEIMRAEGVFFGFMPDGKLFFTEYFRGHRWITIMDPSGKFLKALPIKIGQNFGVTKAVPLETGGFLAEVFLSGKPEKEKDFWIIRNPVRLMRIDPEGRVIGEVIHSDYIGEISLSNNGGDQWIPYCPGFHWFLYGKDSVFFSDGLSRKIRRLGLDGKTVREIEADLPEPEKVTQKAFDSWREERLVFLKARPNYQQSGRVLEKYKKSFHDKKPNMHGMWRTPEGNILVEKGSDQDNGKNEYWLMDEQGEAKAHLAIAGWNLVFSKRFVFLMTQNEMEEIAVRAFPRRDSEDKDMMGLKDAVFD